MNAVVIILGLFSLVLAGLLFVFGMIWWRAAYAIGECMRRGVSMAALDYSTRPFELLVAGYFPVKNSWGFVESAADAQLADPPRVRLTAVEPTMRLFAVAQFVLAGLHFGLTFASALIGLFSASLYWVMLAAGFGVLGFVVLGGLFLATRHYFVHEGIEKAQLD